MENKKEVEKKLTHELKIGNTLVRIFEPQLTKEENDRRLKSLEDTIGRLYGCKCTLTINKT
ncbi:MAG: hypothetical protein Q8942_13285 [Bacillota bacterium]|nr:hypothetical protein [Bacillota bacterium]